MLNIANPNEQIEFHRASKRECERDAVVQAWKLHWTNDEDNCCRITSKNLLPKEIALVIESVMNDIMRDWMRLQSLV